MNHLLLSFQNHYTKNLTGEEVSFKKIYTEIIFIKEERNVRETSIEVSEHEEGFASHLSKGSGTMIRKTKGSKESERGNKLSLIDPATKKSKLKNIKQKESKSKKDVGSSKNKNPRHSLSKSPQFKSNSKESIIIRSQKSKESLHQKSSIPSIPSIKLLSSPNKSKQLTQNPKNTEK
jgi:hypothetical protein